MDHKVTKATKKGDFVLVCAEQAQFNGLDRSEISTPPVRPLKKFAENQPGFQKAMGPFPQRSLVPRGPSPPEKGEFGSVLGAQAQIDGLVPSEFSAPLARPF